MTTLDPKALEEAKLAFGRRTYSIGGGAYADAIEDAIHAYQSSASKAELPEEVAASIAKLEKEAAFIIGAPGCREAYAAMTDAITLLSALASRAQTPPGWKLVPVEPSREMWAAMGDAIVGYKQRHHDKVAKQIWTAALAAAPSPKDTP